MGSCLQRRECAGGAGSYADASAEVRTGVVQEVNGGLGSNLAANATNTGTLALKATATAVGTGASADAWADGVDQLHRIVTRWMHTHG